VKAAKKTAHRVGVTRYLKNGTETNDLSRVGYPR
jgi:hypothetical protein